MVRELRDHRRDRPIAPRSKRAPQLGLILALALTCGVARGQSVELHVEEGSPGDQVTLVAWIGGSDLATAQNDLTFDPAIFRIVAKANGRPDCTVGTEPIQPRVNAFAFRPPGCSGDDCNSMRAIIVNFGPFLDGMLLYRCALAISPEAPFGEYAIGVLNVIFSSPSGERIDGTAVDGVLWIVPAATTNTPLPTATGTATPDGSDAHTESGGGCQLAPGANSSALLLVAALLAYVLRHRR